jgi:hypothetical protein
MMFQHHWRSYCHDRNGHFTLHINVTHSIDTKTDKHIQESADKSLLLYQDYMSNSFEYFKHPCDIYPLPKNKQYVVVQWKETKVDCEVVVEYMCYNNPLSVCEHYLCGEVVGQIVWMWARIIHNKQTPVVRKIDLDNMVKFVLYKNSNGGHFIINKIQKCDLCLCTHPASLRCYLY